MLDHVEWEDAVMQEEIFGPILPVLTYEKLEDALSWINQRPKPLALYCFTENKKVKKTVLEKCRFGGGCINDTLIHLDTSDMDFTILYQPYTAKKLKLIRKFLYSIPYKG